MIDSKWYLGPRAALRCVSGWRATRYESIAKALAAALSAVCSRAHYPHQPEAVNFRRLTRWSVITLFGPSFVTYCSSQRP
jgi:hypothetical protein